MEPGQQCLSGKVDRHGDAGVQNFKCRDAHVDPFNAALLPFFGHSQGLAAVTASELSLSLKPSAHQVQTVSPNRTGVRHIGVVGGLVRRADGATSGLVWVAGIVRLIGLNVVAGFIDVAKKTPV